MSESSPSIDDYLRDLASGDEAAFAQLLPLVYDDLRRLARGIQKRPAHSLNPTALVHEAYARLVRAADEGFDGRRHFMGVAAIAMRQLLADHARERRAAKRGGDAERVTLQLDDALDAGMDLDLVALDEALTAFAAEFPRQAKVVELRFLTGLSVEEAAAVLEVSPRTVKVDWQMARAWLSRALREDESS